MLQIEFTQCESIHQSIQSQSDTIEEIQEYLTGTERQKSKVQENFREKISKFIEILKERQIEFNYKELFVLKKQSKKSQSGLKNLFSQIMAKNPKFLYRRLDIKIDLNLNKSQEKCQDIQDEIYETDDTVFVDANDSFDSNQEDPYANSPNVQDIISLIHYVSDKKLKVILVNNLLQIGMPVPLITPDLQIHSYQFIQTKYKNFKTQQQQNLFQMDFGAISFLNVGDTKGEEDYIPSDMICQIFETNRKDLGWTECNKKSSYLTEGSVTMDIIADIQQLVIDCNTKRLTQLDQNDENFKKIYAVLNLEGNLKDLKSKQCQFLLEKSAIVCVFCDDYNQDYNIINDQIKNYQNKQFLIISKKKILSKFVIKNSNIKYISLQGIRIQNHPQTILKNILKLIFNIKPNCFTNLHQFSISPHVNNKIQKKVQHYFDKLDSIFQNFEIVKSLKEESTFTNCLPKQISDHEDVSKLQKIQQTRNKQKINKTISQFITFLSKVPEKYIVFVNEYIAMNMDQYSYKKLQPLIQKKMYLNQELTRQQNQIQKNKIKQEIIRISDDFHDKSLGIEHIYREIYNYFDVKFDINDGKCHEVLEKLIENKIPIELLDGDHFFVCKNVLQNVVNYMKQKIGNERVLVLSVLGVQSSGKSTLLNSMFNLNFLVSEGRCTRGANLQIFKVDEKESNYKYIILLIDTEGLASAANETLSQDSYSRDNKLASFVVALSDLIIINVFGEDSKPIRELFPMVGKCIVELSVYQRNTTRMLPRLFFVHQATNIQIDNEQFNSKIKDENAKKINDIKKTLSRILETSDSTVDNNPDSYLELNDEDIFYFRQYKKNGKITAEYSLDCQNLKDKILTCEVKNFTILDLFQQRFNIVWNGINSGVYYFDYSGTIDMYLSSILRNFLNEQYEDFQRQIQEAYVKKQNEIDYYTEQNLDKDRKQMNLKKLLQKFENTCQDLYDKSLQNFVDQDKQLPNDKGQYQGRKQTCQKNFQDLCEEIIKKKVEQLQCYYEKEVCIFSIKQIQIQTQQRINKIIIESKRHGLDQNEISQKIEQEKELLLNHLLQKIHNEQNIQNQIYQDFQKTQFYKTNKLFYNGIKRQHGFRLIPLDECKKNFVVHEPWYKLNKNVFKECMSEFQIFLESVKLQKGYDSVYLERLTEELVKKLKNILQVTKKNPKKQELAIIFNNFYYKSSFIYQEKQQFHQQKVKLEIFQAVEETKINSIKMLKEVSQSKQILMMIRDSLKAQFALQLQKQLDLSGYLQFGNKYEYVFISICYLYFQDDFSSFKNFQADKKTQIIRIMTNLLQHQFSIDKPSFDHLKSKEQKYFENLFDACYQKKDIEEFLNTYNEKSEEIKKYQIKSVVQQKLLIDQFKNQELFEQFKEGFYSLRDIPNKIKIKIRAQQIDEFVRQYINQNFGCQENCPLCDSTCQDQRESIQHEHMCQFHFSGYTAGFRWEKTQKASKLNCIQKIEQDILFKIPPDEEYTRYQEYYKHEKCKDWKINLDQKNHDVDNINIHIALKWKNEFEEYHNYEIDTSDFVSQIESDSEFFNTISKFIHSEKIKNSLRCLMENKEEFDRICQNQELS